MKITFASGKGGTGKTSIVANLGVAASMEGIDVLILEADVAMADLSVMFGFEKPEVTLHEVLSGEAKISEAVHSGPEGVKIVPSGISLHGVRKANSEGLDKVVDHLSGEVENLLIDAPSGLGPETSIALRKGENLVLVVTPEITSLSEGLRTKVLAERFGTETLGVVVNKAYGNDYDVPKEEIESMLETSVLATIPDDPEVRRASAYGEPVVTLSEDSPSGKALRGLVSTIFG